MKNFLQTSTTLNYSFGGVIIFGLVIGISCLAAIVYPSNRNISVNAFQSGTDCWYWQAPVILPNLTLKNKCNKCIVVSVQFQYVKGSDIYLDVVKYKIGSRGYTFVKSPNGIRAVTPIKEDDCTNKEESLPNGIIKE